MEDGDGDSDGDQQSTVEHAGLGRPQSMNDE